MAITTGGPDFTFLFLGRQPHSLAFILLVALTVHRIRLLCGTVLDLCRCFEAPMNDAATRNGGDHNASYLHGHFALRLVARQSYENELSRWLAFASDSIVASLCQSKPRDP